MPEVAVAATPSQLSLESGFLTAASIPSAARYYDIGPTWGVAIETEPDANYTVAISYTLYEWRFDENRYYRDTGSTTGASADPTLNLLTGAVRRRFGPGRVHPFLEGLGGLESDHGKPIAGVGAGVQWTPPNSAVDVVSGIRWVTIFTEDRWTRLVPVRVGIRYRVESKPSVQGGAASASASAGEKAYDRTNALPHRHRLLIALGLAETDALPSGGVRGRGLGTSVGLESRISSRTAFLVRAANERFPFDEATYRAERPDVDFRRISGSSASVTTLRFALREYIPLAGNVFGFGEGGVGRVMAEQKIDASGNPRSGSGFFLSSGARQDHGFTYQVGSGLLWNSSRSLSLFAESQWVWMRFGAGYDHSMWKLRVGVGIPM